MQTRLQSLIEVAANVASGFVVAWLTGLWVYPLLGYHVSAGTNTTITVIFTVVSVVRSYLWRRWFNYRHRGAGDGETI